MSSPAGRPARGNGKLTTLIGILALVITFGFTPQEYTLDRYCRPKGLLNNIRAELHGTEFWAKQLTALKSEQRQVEQLPMLRSQIRQATGSVYESSQRLLDSAYRAYPALGPSTTEHTARLLRDAADDIEHAELQRLLHSVMADRWIEMQNCEDEVMQRATGRV